MRELLAGLDAYPAYYAHMGPANAAGRRARTCQPPRRADAAELRRRIKAGEWVVDLRARRAFAAGHVAGTLSFDLDGSFATYLGWLIPWGTPLTLLGHTPEQIAEAQRELVRIGIDRPAAAATGRPATGPAASRCAASRGGLHRPGRGPPPPPGGHPGRAPRPGMGGVTHRRGHPRPAARAARPPGDVPAGELWVHCRAGYRASVAASFLDAAGRTVVAVDDEYDRAARAGLPVEG